MHIKRTTCTWSDKFKDLLLESTDRFRISNIIIKLIPLSNSGREKEFRKYSGITLNKGVLLRFLVARVDKTLGITSKK